ncbi:MAG TPA: bifunctional oligoribonuclease/PAP phosphatase NrnA [Anaerolineaceae bacterium]|nr:bifunctional oligoribonuclease/PAP phosphatase NrnA [Anaerolineaceae bacterium]
MNEEVQRAIRNRIEAAQTVLVVSHIRPDGDAIGSLLGLGLALQQAGKSVQMVLSDGVPKSFRHLPGNQLVTRSPKGDFDLIVVVDCSDMLRTGAALNGLRAPDVNIDHHVTNLNFAEINLVDPEAVATAALLAKSMPLWGLSISRDVASNLLSGLISDTLGFRTSNMTPEALCLAADLMKLGADLPELYSEALARRSFEAVQYWAAGLNRIQRKGRVVWTSLTLADREAIPYPGNDDADLINVLSGIYDYDVALIFVEQRGGKVKVSWRSQPGIDVSKVALSFGGGGHPAASGAEIQGDLASVQDSVLQATEKILSNGHETLE